MPFNLKGISFKRFLIITLGIISMLSMGTIYSWSVFRIPLEKEMGITTALSGLPFLVFLALYSFSMPFAGKLIEKYKPSTVAVAGSIVLSLSYLLSGFCSSIYQLVLTYGIIGGIGVGILYGVPVAMASRWFPNSKGIATGATLLGFGLSPLLTAPIASFLIENYGVNNTFKILGLVFLTFLPAIAMFFKNPVDYSQSNSKVTVVENELEIIKDRRFILLWLLFFIVAFSGLMTISISSPFSQHILDISHTDAAIILSLFAFFNGFGRLIFGVLIDKAGLHKVMNVSFLLLIVTSLSIATLVPKSSLQFVISMSVVWGVFGGWLTIVPISVIQFFGRRNSSKNYGILFTAYGFGAIAGVTLASKAKEFTGGYQSVFYVVFTMSILGFIIIRKMLN